MRDLVVLAALALSGLPGALQLVAEPVTGAAEIPVLRPTGAIEEEPVDAPAVGGSAVACVQSVGREPSFTRRHGHAVIRLAAGPTLHVLVRTWC